MIWNILKLMLTRGTNIKRWNNFPRVEYVSFLDNIGFVLHIALFLANIEEKQSINSLDKVYIIKKVMFWSLKWLMLSDINAGTRDYIRSINKEMYEQVEEEALKKIFSLPWNQSIKDDIQQILLASKEREDLIIQAARKYSAWCECKVNAQVYEESFEIPMNLIKKELDELSKNLASINYLMKHTDSQKYLTHIRRLSHSIRWSGENRLVAISVMAHLVIVAMISYFIAMIEQEGWKDIDLENLLFIALYHDIPEAITGDIISPVKNSIPWFGELIEEAEKKMLDDYLFCYISPEYKSSIVPFMFHPFETEWGKLVKYADIVSALYEAKIEVLFWNNRDYEAICYKLESKLVDIDLRSVNYLLKNWLLEFNEKNIVQ
jgi:putative hydrolases of HD superfamily